MNPIKSNLFFTILMLFLAYTINAQCIDTSAISFRKNFINPSNNGFTKNSTNSLFQEGINNFFTSLIYYSDHKHCPEAARLAYNDVLRYNKQSIEIEQQVHKRIRQSRNPLQQASLAEVKKQINFLDNINNGHHSISNIETVLPKYGIDLEFEYKYLHRMNSNLLENLEESGIDLYNYTWENINSTLNKNEAAIEIIRVIKKKDLPTLGKSITDRIIDFSRSGIVDTALFNQEVKRMAGGITREVNDAKDTSMATYIILITSPKFVTPKMVSFQIDAEQEKKDFKKYQDENRSDKYTTNQSYIAQFYWKPIADKIQGIERVYLSTDGIYSKMNINTLKIGNKYLLEQLDIRLVSTTRSLMKLKQKEKNIQKLKNIVLIGNPNYNADLVKGQAKTKKNALNWETLPDTEEEVNSIEALFKNKSDVTLWVGNEATEQNFKKVSQPSILHIATHGVFEKRKERYFDGMVADIGKRSTPANSVGGIANPGFPLWWSKLIFAGANSYFFYPGKEFTNALVSGSEIMMMDLTDTELVVLSACNTGKAEGLSGQYPYGLQRAFFAAGAERLISSLWSVREDVTQEFMVLFYKKWVNNSKMELYNAFREAQIELIDDFPEPYLWGGFQMVTK